MTPAATEDTTITPAAGAAGAASTTEADAAAKAAADKAAADKATADAAAANAGKTPEQLAAEKVAADKVIADKAAADAAAEAAKKVVPEKYELKLPDETQVSSAIVERTAAIARELGLSQDNAQKTLTFVAQQAAAEVQAQLATWEQPSEANPEGGAKWREQDDAWRAASLADQGLGNGKPDQLKAVVTRATQVVAKFGDTALTAFFEKSGLGSNPATLRFLNKIGLAMSEGSLVIADGSTARANTDEAKAERLYDHPTSKK